MVKTARKCGCRRAARRRELVGSTARRCGSEPLVFRPVVVSGSKLHGGGFVMGNPSRSVCHDVEFSIRPTRSALALSRPAFLPPERYEILRGMGIMWNEHQLVDWRDEEEHVVYDWRGWGVEWYSPSSDDEFDDGASGTLGTQLDPDFGLDGGSLL